MSEGSNHNRTRSPFHHILNEQRESRVLADLETKQSQAVMPGNRQHQQGAYPESRTLADLETRKGPAAMPGNGQNRQGTYPGGMPNSQGGLPPHPSQNWSGPARNPGSEPGLAPAQDLKRKKNSPVKVALLGSAALLVVAALVFVVLGVLQKNTTDNAQTTHQQPQPTSIITATPEPTPDALQLAKNKAHQIMDGMTLDEKLGQLIIVEYIGATYTSILKEMLVEQHVGGLLYQESNHNFDAPTDSIAAVAELSKELQRNSKIPLLIGTDQEGGQVNRLYLFHGDRPSAADLVATGDPNEAQKEGKQTAEWMLELGINCDLAPVVDVNAHVLATPILQDRLFGDTAETVVSYAGAYLDGLQQNGVIGTLKHFPGLGSITSDPHNSLPVVQRSKDELMKTDLVPYKELIKTKNPAMIMTTDILLPAIDPNLPAELSPRIVNGILRDELGYNGVIITDGLYMEGISNTWSMGEAVTLAIIAGNDLVEGPYTVDDVTESIQALKQAIQDGKLTEQRIDQSVERVLMMKIQYGIIK